MRAKYASTAVKHDLALSHLTIAHRLCMGSIIFEDWLQASAKRVVEE
jgi:hypothetical protein